MPEQPVLPIPQWVKAHNERIRKLLEHRAEVHGGGVCTCPGGHSDIEVRP